MRYPSLLIGLLLLSAYPQAVGAAQFIRILKIGDVGEDVRMLQQLLNEDSRTQVAATGPGSPGNETVKFGARTRSAVVRFQELYPGEILAPAGLLRGTGIVGPKTIALLHQKMTTSDSTLTSALIESAPAKAIQDSAKTSAPLSATVAIESLSRSSADVGTEIIVRGSGLSGKTMTVLFDDKPVTGTVSGGEVSFIVPVGTLEGLHSIKILAADGESNLLKIRVEGGAGMHAGGSAYAGAPIIENIYPLRGGPGTTVMITGKNFSSLPENTIYAGYAKLQSVASMDGKTMSFTIPTYLPQFDFAGAEWNELVEATLPFWVYIENGKGMSNAQLFTYIIK